MPKPTNHGEIIGRLAAMDRLLCHLAHKVQDAGRAAKSAALAQEAPDVLSAMLSDLGVSSSADVLDSMLADLLGVG